MSIVRTVSLAAAGLVLAAGASAADGPATPNNNLRPTPTVEIPTAAVVNDGKVELTNTGGLARIEFTGHVLNVPVAGGVEGGGPTVLYAPSADDDAAFRGDISAITGGSVDYFDTRVDTPTLALLESYDAVFTWVNLPYADDVLFGDRLADFVDGGGTVVLGAFCTFTSGNSLAGDIMTPAYSPVVSPTGTNLFSPSDYTGDGITCLYDGVGSLNCNFRDDLVLQGAGVLDGTYADGAICHAYRPDGRVVYSNGSGGAGATCSGDAAVVIANAVSCLGSSISCACNGEYEVGQRVVSIVDAPGGNSAIGFGRLGTVICGSPFSPPLLVLWDEFDGGHDGLTNCDCPADGGSGSGTIVMPGTGSWFVNCEDVTAACAADVDGDLDVGFGDILEVLSNWGSCL